MKNAFIFLFSLNVGSLLNYSPQIFRITWGKTPQHAPYTLPVPATDSPPSPNAENVGALFTQFSI